MKILFMGTPVFGQIVLENLLKTHEVGLVVTQPDKRVGRRGIITPSEVKEIALKHNIEVFQPFKMKEDYQKIIDYNPDLIVTAAYGQMIPSEIIDNFTCVNIHGSILPKHRGGAPIQRAIMEGDEYTGVTLMYMANEMDSGDIIDVHEIKIEDHHTTSILMEKLAQLGSELLLKHINDIVNKKAPRIPQDHSLATFSYNLTKEDEILDFNKPTFLVLRKLNGLLDEPAPSFYINGKRVKVYKLQKSDIIKSAKCGEVLSITKVITIKTADGAVDILELQEQSRKKMITKDYLNGQKLIKKGDVANE